MKRARIALFTPYFPAPAFTGGRVRIQHFAHALGQLAELDLFAKAPRREAEDERARVESQCYAHIHSAPASLSLSPRAWRWPRRVRTANPMRLARAFRAQHALRPYDVMVVEHAHAAAAAIGCGVPWLLDEHNIESQYLEAKLRAAGAMHVWQRPELWGLRRWEERCWREASEVVAVTRADADCVAAVRGKPASHIPNGVDVARLPFTPLTARSGAEILFVGLMDHPPNVHAACWLAERVMPEVWVERPDARLVLCGANPSPRVAALAGARVRVTGRVESVAPYFAAARVFANALAFGGGSSLKVLEALAAGVPLVSTRVGTRGFGLRPDEHYLAAESSAEFAGAILRCLRDDEPGRLQRAAVGRAFAEAHAWQPLAERFAALALGLVGRR